MIIYSLFRVNDFLRKCCEGGEDEGAFSVAWGEGGCGPGVDNDMCLIAPSVIAGGSVHEDQLPCALGIALDLWQDFLAS